MTQFLIERESDGVIVGAAGQPDAPDAGPAAETPASGGGYRYIPWQQPVAFSAEPTPTSVLKFTDRPVWVETAPLADAIASLQRQIDREHDQIITDRIGAKAREYEDAYRDAIAYRDAGWSGTAPESVADYAAIRGWSAQQAAQDVIDTGNAWIAASRDMRNSRIARKQDAGQAADAAAIAAVRLAWTRYRDGMRAALGIAPAF